VSISPTFHEQPLLGKIPKAQKATDDLTVFVLLLGSACVKAALKHVGKIYPAPLSHPPSLSIFSDIYVLERRLL